MSNKPKIHTYKTLSRLVTRLRDDLNNKDFVLLYAYNGTGKTRLSMAFKEQGKSKPAIERDTLYFNAFTEDLFHWDNDLPGDSHRRLKINSDSRFFLGFKELALEEKIFAYLARYADFDFKIDYENWTITFSRGDVDHIKVSRGEENIFILCIFLAICELTIDGAEAYAWVRFLYIDDPISSLDDNNAIAVASDLAQLLKRSKDRVKTVISSHHGLFFNVMCNELKKSAEQEIFPVSRQHAGQLCATGHRRHAILSPCRHAERAATGGEVGPALHPPLQHAARHPGEDRDFFWLQRLFRLHLRRGR